MKLLLDSHIFSSTCHNPSLVPLFQRETIADRSNEVFVSAATAWELGIKQSKKKLALRSTVSEQQIWFGFLELPITFAHAEYAAGLSPFHNDPFDRIARGAGNCGGDGAGDGRSAPSRVSGSAVVPVVKGGARRPLMMLRS